MARRGVPEDIVERVLDRFGEVGLIDDTAFAAAWVESRHRGRGLGKRALAAELRRRGVEDEVAAEALSAVTAADEQAAAVELVRRRLRSLSGLPRDVQTRRLVALLGRKGFSSGLAYRVVIAAVGEAQEVLPSM
jgi:regulatory protein